MAGLDNDLKLRLSHVYISIVFIYIIEVGCLRDSPVL